MSEESLIKEVRDDMNRMRGLLFGAVESIGLPTKQENAFKGVVRTLTYDAQSHLEATIRNNGRV